MAVEEAGVNRCPVKVLATTPAREYFSWPEI
jgi:hypothetical protein